MIGMKLQSLFRRKEKLTNHLVINAEAHQGFCRLLTGTAHMAMLTAAVRGWRLICSEAKKKNLKENIWVVLFKYLELPDTAAAIQGWQGRACL